MIFFLFMCSYYDIGPVPARGIFYL